MLVLTEAAAEVVKSFTSNPQVPDGAGLRIASSTPGTGSPDSLQVTATAAPGDNDQVIEKEGARVYVEPLAAAYLDDKVLDAQVDGEGKAHFYLGEQGPAPV
ncbi:MAG TPA: Fe-S cluster assembly protein HesB [Trebonia sp.]|jgi:iron-sulfur cluster assembly protein|nr:Fe-S cluster assembly protein HesB [Trebonia sp.]